MLTRISVGAFLIKRIEIAAATRQRVLAGKVILGELKNGPAVAGPQTPWAALGAANRIITENQKSFNLVSLYDEIRTFFKRND